MRDMSTLSEDNLAFSILYLLVIYTFWTTLSASPRLFLWTSGSGLGRYYSLMGCIGTRASPRSRLAFLFQCGTGSEGIGNEECERYFLQPHACDILAME